MHHTTIRRVLLLGAFTAAGIASAAAYDAATHEAHAADKPGIVAEQGGLLGHDLPTQASDRAKAVVAKVTAPKPAPTEDTPAEPEPSKPAEPQPAPSDEPTEPTPPVEAPPADKPVELPPVEVPVPVELPELPPVEVPPLPAPPPVELPPTPRTDPLPLPVVDIPDPQLPAPPPVPELLPVTIGPLPAAEPPTGGVVNQLIAELTAGEEQPACADDPDDARHIDRDALRALLAGLHDKPTATASESNPCRPQIPAADTTGAGQVKPPPPTAADLIVANLIGSHVPPALGRLEHARARSHLPASRHVAIEPGPA